MPALIAQLIALFGPILTEWLSKWLESLLNRAAQNMPRGSESDVTGLFAEAVQLIPRRAFARRALVRTLGQYASRARAEGWGALPPDAAEELRDYASAADES